MAARGAILERIGTVVVFSMGWAALGFIAGVVIVSQFVRPHNPAEPLSGEGGLGVIVAVFEAAIGGGIVGLFEGLLWRPGIGFRTFIWGLIGLCVGYGVALFLPDTGPDIMVYRAVACVFSFAWLFNMAAHLHLISRVEGPSA